MINKLITSGLSGASLIAAVLLINGFNPAHNKHWLIGAGLIAATSTGIAELTTRKKPQITLKETLKQNIRRLPYGSDDYQLNLDMLIALNRHENRDI